MSAVTEGTDCSRDLCKTVENFFRSIGKIVGTESVNLPRTHWQAFLCLQTFLVESVNVPPLFLKPGCATDFYMFMYSTCIIVFDNFPKDTWRCWS